MTKEITISQKELKNVLSITKTFIEKKGSMPILSHCYMRVYAKTCEILATDLEVSYKTYMPCSNESDLKFKTCIPVVLFFNAVKGLKTPDITIAFEDNHILVNGVYKIMTLSWKEYPAYPKMKDFKTVTIPDFIEKLSRVSIASGESDTRYVLNTVCLDFENGVISGANGHRLHYEDIPVYEGYGKVLIPINAIKRLIKNKAKDTFIFTTEKHLLADTVNGKILTRLIEGNYPKIENILANEDSTSLRILVSREKLVEVLRNASLMSKDRGNAIVLTINRCLSVTASNPDTGDFSANIPCKRDDSIYEDIKIGLNARYLIESLQAYSDTDAILDIQNSMAPCFINSHAVVMPLRV